MKLNSHWTNYLLKQPESGMGYQKVQVTLKSGIIINDAIVLNSEDLSLPIPKGWNTLTLEDISRITVIR